VKYIDIHCHLDFKDYDADRSQILERMKEGEVGAITIGADLESSKRAVEIAETNENIWACIGVHPEEVSKGAFDTPEFEKLVKSPKVVGIGECGLDYFKINSEEEKINQKDLFEKQIQFAIKHNKPLMLHCRDSYDDVLDILKNYKEAEGPEAAKLKGNVHFFAGNVSIAKKFLDLGFTLSFTGVITFTHDYDEVIKYIPQNSIMSETDAPFVAPMPYRGKRNEPSFVIEVVKKMAEIRCVSKEIRGENVDILNNAIMNNAQKVFGV
jgi:TatD DNase family protein